MFWFVLDRARLPHKRFPAHKKLHRCSLPAKFAPPATVSGCVDRVTFTEVVYWKGSAARERYEHHLARALTIGLLAELALNARVCDAGQVDRTAGYEDRQGDNHEDQELHFRRPSGVQPAARDLGNGRTPLAVDGTRKLMAGEGTACRALLNNVLYNSVLRCACKMASKPEGSSHGALRKNPGPAPALPVGGPQDANPSAGASEPSSRGEKDFTARDPNRSHHRFR